jgi:DNA polymerase delta subunit 2
MEDFVDPDSLLCTVTEDEILDRAPLERVTCPYAPASMRFRLKERKFKTQYAHVYFCRLNVLRKSVEDTAKKLWGEDIVIRKLVDVKVEQEVCIVGTTFKEMSLKPSILKEISDAHNLLPFPAKKRKYVSPTDKLVLEDESQRITLTGNIPTQDLITGIIMAVKGYEMTDGQFHVREYCFAGVPPLATPTIPVDYSQQNDMYIALVSGLNVGSDHCSQLSIEMLVDYLAGHLGGPKDHEHIRHVARVIIAGNSITDKPAKSNIKEEKKKKYSVKNYAAHSVEAVKELDGVLAQLASCVPVDIMPGSHDPVNFILPQQPFRKCVFPRGAKSEALRGVTNPFVDEVNGRM